MVEMEQRAVPSMFSLMLPHISEITVLSLARAQVVRGGVGREDTDGRVANF